MKFFNQMFTREQFEQRFLDVSQVCGIQSLTCNEGLETGTKILKLWNASGINLDIIPDRAMDLGRLFYKGVPLTWSSGTGYVNPAFLQDMGWVKGFHGGLVATCGLNNVGPACVVDDETHEQHGRISRLPASQVTYATEWEDQQILLKAKGTIHDRTSKGYHMKLSREIIVEGNESIIRLHDEVTNLGIDDAVFMLKYHMNFGYPLIDEQTAIHVPVAISETNTLISDLTHEVEVKYIECSSEDSSPGEVRLINPFLNIELAIRYSKDTLPHLWRWHNFKKGMHVLAIEPSNCEVKPRSAAKESNSLKVLKPGESQKFSLEIEVREIGIIKWR